MKPKNKLPNDHEIIGVKTADGWIIGEFTYSMGEPVFCYDNDLGSIIVWEDLEIDGWNPVFSKKQRKIK